MPSKRWRTSLSGILLALVLAPWNITTAQTAATATQATAAPPAATMQETGCCGPVTPQGKHLRQLLDGMDVDHLWLNHLHIDWETGKPDRGPNYDGPDTKSHCSSFAAAVGERLGIYMLRPPDHPQQLLASAQGKWFESKEARDKGWTPVNSSREAQRLANLGELVVITFVSPDPHKPGHIAIVRPAMKTDEALAAEGPQTTQAGGTNFSNGTAKESFRLHENAWPNGVKMYAHVTNFGVGSSSATP
jgi:hypothetical protein